jgi:hypothetical protein
MHSHAEPIGGFFSTHVLDTIGDSPHIVGVVHGCERPKENTEIEGKVFRQWPGHGSLRQKTGHRNSSLLEPLEYSVFD